MSPCTRLAWKFLRPQDSPGRWHWLALLSASVESFLAILFYSDKTQEPCVKLSNAVLDFNLLSSFQSSQDH
jgi:hypothetical protein